MLRKFTCFLPLLIGGSLWAQVQTVQAIKVNRAPKIDGNLDDSAWRSVPSITNFTQNFPDWGKPATRETDVKIVYDNSAIYVGAYLFDDPVNIRRQLTARDAEQQTDADYFSVFFDTYNYHQKS